MYFSSSKMRFALIAVAILFTVGCTDMVGRLKQNLTPSQPPSASKEQTPKAAAAEQGETIEYAVHVAKDGTSTFYAYRGSIEVTSDKTGERITLKPGEMVTVGPGKRIKKGKISPDSVPALTEVPASVKRQVTAKKWPNRIKRP
jgi:quercetin dioxygenase-like cupin family protein